MHSSDLLVEALNKYEGSFILVSHDRYFISKTANKIWEIVDHKIKEFKGGYEEYVQWKERMEKTGKSNESRQSKENKEDRIQKIEEKKQAAPPVNKEQKKELQKQQKIFQQLEERIAKLKEKKSQLEAALSDPSTYSDKNKFLQTENDYQKASEELAKLNSDYEKVFEKIMELEDQ
jgi:ATP-binding cassette subfamily F protein 3